MQLPRNLNRHLPWVVSQGSASVKTLRGRQITNTNMTKPFSSNPKLANWVPSEQQIQTITAAHELWDLVPEEEGDDLNLFKINDLDVRSPLHPEVTAPEQLWDDTLGFIQMCARNHERARDRREEQN